MLHVVTFNLLDVGYFCISINLFSLFRDRAKVLGKSLILLECFSDLLGGEFLLWFSGLRIWLQQLESLWEVRVQSPVWCTGLKDQALLQLQLRFTPWPRNFHMLQVWPLKKKKKDLLSGNGSVQCSINKANYWDKTPLCTPCHSPWITMVFSL